MASASPPRIVAVEGLSGAGKTTVSRRVAEAVGGRWLREAYDRLGRSVPLGYSSRAELLRIEETFLLDESRRYSEAVQAKRLGFTTIADTGFLGPLTYAAGLVRELKDPTDVRAPIARELEGLHRRSRWGLPDLHVYLDASPRVRRQRATLDRAGHPEEFIERHEKVGRYERRFWLTTGRRYLPGRVLVVPAASPVDTVVRRVIERIERSPIRGAPPTGAVAPLLSALTSDR